MAIRFQIGWETFRRDVRFPLFISGIGILLTLYYVVQSVVSVINFHEAPDLIAPLPAVHAASDLSQYHLLGTYQKNQNLPATHLPLYLQGVAFSVASASTSRVFIAIGGQPAHSYKIGDVITDGATVQQIFRDQVIINDRGHLEYLKLPIPKIN